MITKMSTQSRKNVQTPHSGYNKNLSFTFPHIDVIRNNTEKGKLLELIILIPILQAVSFSSEFQYITFLWKAWTPLILNPNSNVSYFLNPWPPNLVTTKQHKRFWICTYRSPLDWSQPVWSTHSLLPSTVVCKSAHLE